MSPETRPRIRFYVATHKPWPLPAQALYQPIGLGGYRPEGTGSALSDADGHNIAHLNPHYSELTGWYWIWKNVRDVDMIGPCHYRRYFFFHTEHPSFVLDKLYMEPTPENMAGLFSLNPEALVASGYHENAVFVPRPFIHNESISACYIRYHRQQDWECFLQAIAETSAPHARQMHRFATEGKMYLYNMMIAPWGFFDDYMAVLMEVLRKVESMIRYPDDAYQRRIPAFLAERFFTLHLMTVKPKLLEAPVVITDMSAN